MSLTKSQPVWTSCGSNSYEIHKASVAVKMLSGRYPTDMLRRHWTDNTAGYCLLTGCKPLLVQGTLEHLLLFCPSLGEKRQTLLALVSRVSSEHPILRVILANLFCRSSNTQDLMQLLLDCSVVPYVIQAAQMIIERLQYLGRAWC